MKIKNMLSTIGNGVLDAGAALSNASVRGRIHEIDEEIQKLQEERATLVKRLI